MEPENPQTPPTVQGPPLAEKPVRAKKYLIMLLFGLFLFAALLVLIHNVRVALNEQRTNPPTTTSPELASDMDRRNREQAARMNAAAHTGTTALIKAAQAAKDAQLPEEDHSDGTTALLNQYNNPRATPALSPAAQRRKDALESTAVPIDFTTEAGKAPAAPPDHDTNMIKDHDTYHDEPDTQPSEAPTKALGPTFKLYEGSILETVLLNRLEGAFTGPVKTMATTAKWSDDNQTLLIPQGTIFIGEAAKVASQDQERLAVVFHSMQRPCHMMFKGVAYSLTDGCSSLTATEAPISLDKFTGLDQIGATALRDKVNHHWVRAFGFSIALGGIAGLTQIGNGYSGFGYDPAVSIRSGISQQMGQEATQMLDRYLNVPPTITIRERTRVKIWIAKTLDLPAYIGKASTL